MDKIFVVFLVVAVASTAFGMSFRHKRQSKINEDGLDERYGFDDQNGRWPWLNPNQNRFPNENQNRIPNQNQNRFPNQDKNRFPSQNQNQFPNQNQNQFPSQNLNGGRQFPWQNENLNGGGLFPWQNQNQNSGQGQFPWINQNQRTTTTTQAPNGNGGVSSNAGCLQNCPVTSEYNPVCGTDNVTYTNPGRLGCAQACGANVSLLRSAPCPTTTVAPSS